MRPTASHRRAASPTLAPGGRRALDPWHRAGGNERRQGRIWSAGIVLAAALLGGCGGGGEASGVSLPAQAAAGRNTALGAGCSSCHGVDFGGGIGPSWIGLAGSTVELADGTTVVADTAYLTRAIADPSAERVAGAATAMPPNGLSADDIADIVAYIETLAAP